MCKTIKVADEHSILADEQFSSDEVNGDAVLDKADVVDDDAEPGKDDTFWVTINKQEQIIKQLRKM